MDFMQFHGDVRAGNIAHFPVSKPDGTLSMPLGMTWNDGSDPAQFGAIMKKPD